MSSQVIGSFFSASTSMLVFWKWGNLPFSIFLNRIVNEPQVRSSGITCPEGIVTGPNVIVATAIATFGAIERTSV